MYNNVPPNYYGQRQPQQGGYPGNYNQAPQGGYPGQYMQPPQAGYPAQYGQQRQYPQQPGMPMVQPGMAAQPYGASPQGMYPAGMNQPYAQNPSSPYSPNQANQTYAQYGARPAQASPYQQPMAQPYQGVQQPYPGAMPMGGAIPPNQVPAGAKPVAPQPQKVAPGPQPSANGYPSITPCAYVINESMKNIYANLYGIIAAVNTLEMELIDGNVSQEEATPILEPLKSNFHRIIAAQKLAENDIRSFCDSVHLEHSLAVSELFSSAPGPASPQNDAQSSKPGILPADIATLTANIITLANQCDFCSQMMITVQQHNQLFQEVKKGLQKVGMIPAQKEAAAMIEKWSQKFQSLDEKGQMPDADVMAFKNDILAIQVLFHDFVDNI